MKYITLILFTLLAGCAYQHDLTYTPIQTENAETYCLKTHRHGWVLFYLFAENHCATAPATKVSLLPATDCQNTPAKRWYGFDPID